jgi:hypothetical protein
VEKRTDIRGPEVYTYDIGVLGSQAFATSLSCCSVFEYYCVAPVLRILPLYLHIKRWVGLGSRLVDGDTGAEGRRRGRCVTCRPFRGFARASLRLRAGTQARIELKRRSENHSEVQSIVACSLSAFTLPFFLGPSVWVYILPNAAPSLQQTVQTSGLFQSARCPLPGMATNLSFTELGKCQCMIQ